MSTNSKRSAIQEEKLKSLQSWRELRLEEAQVEHERARSAENRRRQTVDDEQQKVQDCNETARLAMTRNAIISTEALTRIRQFTTLTLADLKNAQNALEEASNALLSAHADLVKKSTDVRAVEKLREKRHAERGREGARREQKLLDEHASIRFANDQERSSDK